MDPDGEIKKRRIEEEMREEENKISRMMRNSVVVLENGVLAEGNTYLIQQKRKKELREQERIENEIAKKRNAEWFEQHDYKMIQTNICNTRSEPYSSNLRNRFKFDAKQFFKKKEVTIFKQ